MPNNETLLQRDLEQLDIVGGEHGLSAADALAGTAPDLGQYLLILFGEIYSRLQLDLKRRELVTLAAPATQGGCEKQLHAHVNAAPNIGPCPRRNHRILRPLRALFGLSQSIERGIRCQRSV